MIPRNTVSKVIQRDNGMCVLQLEGCTVVADVADHRANRGSGGSDVLNAVFCLVASCHRCNGRKEDAHGRELAQLKAHGIRVLKAATNHATAARCRMTPVQYPDGVTYWLLEDGTRQPITERRTDG